MSTPIPGRPQRRVGQATLASRDDVTETLAVFRFVLDAGVPQFQPGQFLTLGLPQEGGRTEWRAYSIASPPHVTSWVELYVRKATEPLPGLLTSALWGLPLGGALPHRGIAGAFTIDDLLPSGQPDRRSLLCAASGTGVAPFVAQALDLQRRDVPRLMVVAHGASHVRELAYDALFRGLESATRDARGFRLRYVPTISRPADPANAAWTGETGRVEALLAAAPDGEPCRLERLLGERFEPGRWFGLACGFDAAVAAATAALAARGFVTRRARRADGSFDMKSEGYG